MGTLIHHAAQGCHRGISTILNNCWLAQGHSCIASYGDCWWRIYTINCCLACGHSSITIWEAAVGESKLSEHLDAKSTTRLVAELSGKQTGYGYRNKNCRQRIQTKVCLTAGYQYRNENFQRCIPTLICLTAGY